MNDSNNVNKQNSAYISNANNSDIIPVIKISESRKFQQDFFQGK